MKISFESLQANPSLFMFREALEHLPDDDKLLIPLGKEENGEYHYASLASLGNVFIGGTTGAGKSVFLRNAVSTLLLHNEPTEIRFAFVDPKRVEFWSFKDIPHRACPVIYEQNEFKRVIEILTTEMNLRIEQFRDRGAANLEEYNTNNEFKLPRIVIVIDEYADIVFSDIALKEQVRGILEKGNAVGFHVLMATQCVRNIDLDTIKLCQTKIGFALTDIIDSKKLLGEGGAENLNWHGDMLLKMGEEKIKHLQACYLDVKDEKAVISSLAQ